MKTMLELVYEYPDGFWVCDACDSELYYQEEKGDSGMEYLREVQYTADPSVTHCASCNYAPETGLSLVRLDFI